VVIDCSDLRIAAISRLTDRRCLGNGVSCS